MASLRQASPSTSSPARPFSLRPTASARRPYCSGLTWAVFGDHSNVDGKTCVRVGHQSAEAIVSLAVGDNDRLTIHRTVTIAGKVSVEYSDGGRPIPASTAHEMLVREFGAPIEIAARLAVIRGSGKDDGELQLREHLYDAFGVSGLRNAAAIATKLHKQAEASRKKLRSASRTQLANRDQLAERVASLRNDLDELNARRVPLAEALAAAMRGQQAVVTWTAYDEALAARSNETRRAPCPGSRPRSRRQHFRPNWLRWSLASSRPTGRPRTGPSRNAHRSPSPGTRSSFSTRSTQRPRPVLPHLHSPVPRR